MTPMPRALRQHAVTLLALTGTPLLLFVSSSNTLYLRNQDDLQHTVGVLRPFLGLFLALLAIGAALFAAAARGRLRVLWWMYLAFGPAFALFASFHRQATALDHPAAVAVLLGLTVTVSALLTRRFEPRQAVRPVALASAFLIVGELFVFVTRYQPQAAVAPRPAAAAESHAAARRPNIYHVILDEYQTDMFQLTLTPEIERALAGFVFFPRNTAVYGRTGMSLPSIFSGRAYDYQTPQIEYQKAAFGSEASLLHWLKQGGYARAGYIHDVFTFPLPLFDATTFHKDNLGRAVEINYGETFWNLWFYANTPSFVARRFAQKDQLDQLATQNLLSSAAPIMSYHSFERILQREADLPAWGRYTFVHLVLPHFPNVLRSDCSYVTGKDETTGPLEQAGCATQLILALVAELKRLDRFESSLIIAHSDHGSRYVVIDGALVATESKGLYSTEWSWARSRALLLIKPAGRTAFEPLVVSPAETELTDLFPTIMRSVGLEPPPGLTGVALVEPVPLALARRRYYHFYDKKGPNEWTDQLARFVIEDGQIRFDANIPLPHNTPERS